MFGKLDSRFIVFDGDKTIGHDGHCKSPALIHLDLRQSAAYSLKKRNILSGCGVDATVELFLVDPSYLGMMGWQ